MPAISAIADILDKAADMLMDPAVTSDELDALGLPGQRDGDKKLLSRTRDQVVRRFGSNDDLRIDVEICVEDISRRLPPKLPQHGREHCASQFRSWAERLREFVAERLKKAKELRRLRKKRPPGDREDGPWSKPDSPSRWAKIFNISTRTFVRHVEEKAIHAKKLSDKSYQVALSDIPMSSSRPPS
jgi:hypothetical protein